jgi:pilus assembly protein CpaC
MSVYKDHNWIAAVALNEQEHADRHALPRFQVALFFILVMTLTWLLTALSAQAQQIVHIPANSATAVQVAKGKPQTVETETPFSEIVVGDAEIADVSPLTNTSFVIMGKKIGTTGLALFNDDKKLVATIDLEISYDTQRLQNTLRQQLSHSGVTVTSANGQIVLSGDVQDSKEAEKAQAIASQFGETIINSLSVNATTQVQLEVRFLEATREASKELGVQWSALNGVRGASIGKTALGSNDTPFGTLVGRFLTGGYQVDAVIRALEESGTARRLAEPNLVTLSGDTASFLAGGEFPFLVPGSNGTTVVEFKKFGVGLEFTPTVMKNQLIHLQVKPEVSEIDPSRNVTVGNLTIPGITVRRASTTVELRDGQSFVIGGLLQATNTSNQEGVPWLGDVPVLGSLFRSPRFRKQETDLIIIVTPRLVAPLSPDQMVETPLNDARPSNDAELFLLGKHEVATRERILQASVVHNGQTYPTGHILDLAERTEHVSKQ